MDIELAPGAGATRELVVGTEHCTRRADHHIYSTPELVLLIELTAIDALAPYLPSDRSSVGSRVDIAHSAPTLSGQTVYSTVTVTEVDRRRVEFEVSVRDDVEEIATGTHQRFIVDEPKFGARLDEKRSQIEAAGSTDRPRGGT